MKKGDKLPSESVLIETLHVGRNTIRAALNRLTAIGLIESRQGEGYYIRDINASLFMNSLIPILVLSSGDLISLTQYRIGVESQTAAVAAVNADEKDLEQMKRLLKLAEDNIDNEKVFATIDMDFHLSVAKASKNDIFYQAFDIIKRLYTVWLVGFVTVHGRRKSNTFHNEIYNSIKNRDSIAAKRYMTMHLEDVLNKVKKDIEKNNNDIISVVNNKI